MELVEGSTLKEVASLEQPDEAHVVRWAGELLRLIDHVSGRSSVVIRELRPVNIILTDDSQLKVMDIGMSRLLRGGTIPGKSKTRPELRALGGCLYELLTQIPAPELSDRPIAGELFRRVNLVNPDVSEEIADAVERMVDPLSEPFKSSEEVKLNLGLAGQPIPKREKKEKARKKEELFDPERIDPAEEKAALRTLIIVVSLVAVFLFGIILWEKNKHSLDKQGPLLTGPPAPRPKNFKWTPASRALKEYLDDLGGYAWYERTALNAHTLISRKHHVQAATNTDFMKQLSNKVIPNYQKFYDNLRSIVIPNDEIRKVHDEYVTGARLLLTGYREQRKALVANSVTDLDRANVYISQGNLHIGLWVQGVRNLEKKYGVYDTEEETTRH